MINDNKIVKKIIPIAVILVVSLLASFMLVNFRIIKNTQKHERKDNIINLDTFELNLFSLGNNQLMRDDGNYPSIEFMYDGKYIDKLIFNYSASYDFSWSIDIEGMNSYGKIENKTISGAASSKIDIFSEKIGMKVNKIKISFDGPIIQLSNIKVRNTIDFNKHIFIFILLSVSLVYCLFKHKIYFSKNVEKAFLLIAMVSGILLIYCVPKLTFLSWDDETHFYRAYTLFQYPNVEWTESTNQMRTPIPFNLERINTNEEYEAVAYYFNVNNNYENYTTESKNSAFIEYQRYPYIPSAIALSIGKMLHVSFSVLISMGKIANLLFYCLMTYFAIKIIPCFKKLLTVIALLPSSMWLSTQYSCDPIITSCVFLSISILLYEIYNKHKKLSLKNSLLFILPILFASFAKPIYIPLILLIFLLPKNKFSSTKERIIFKIGIIGLFALVMATFVLPTIVDPNSFTDTRGAGANTSEQMHLIIEKPFGYAEVLYQNAGKYFFDKLFSRTTLSSFAYMGEINSPNIGYVLLILLMFFTFTDQPKKKIFDRKNRILIILIILSIIIMIWSSLYLGFTAVGSINIQGVQWRYFIPLLFPLLICCNNIKIKNEISETSYTQFLYYSSSVIMLLCIYLNIVKVIYN